VLKKALAIEPADPAIAKELKKAADGITKQNQVRWRKRVWRRAWIAPNLRIIALPLLITCASLVTIAHNLHIIWLSLLISYVSLVTQKEKQLAEAMLSGYKSEQVRS
jgi:hypothetical protein